MAKCKSWRYVAAPENPDDYLPVGRDHRVWKPCRNKLPAGQKRCDACQDALITCPSAIIRRALAREKDQDTYVLEALLSDNDPTVASIAYMRLDGGRKGVWVAEGD